LTAVRIISKRLAEESHTDEKPALLLAIDSMPKAVRRDKDIRLLKPAQYPIY
jgi:hypothetical protein